MNAFDLWSFEHDPGYVDDMPEPDTEDCERTCSSCPADECTGHCSSCSYGG